MSESVHNALLKNTRRRFPLAHSMIRQNGVVKLTRKRNADFFVYMAKTVTNQQLSNKAAASIWKKIVELADKKQLSLLELFTTKNNRLIRQCGLSANKIRAITELKQAIETGQISAAKLSRASHEVIIHEINQLWGFGSWSAEMITLFFFAREDIWSDGDAALRRGIGLLSDHDEEKTCSLLNATTPYRSYLSLHIWKALDSGILVPGMEK